MVEALVYSSRLRGRFCVPIEACNLILSVRLPHSNPKPYITHYDNFHVIFHYPYITPLTLHKVVGSGACRREMPKVLPQVSSCLGLRFRV